MQLNLVAPAFGKGSWRVGQLPRKVIRKQQFFKQSLQFTAVSKAAASNSVSLKIRIKAEAAQKVNAMNETERQPGINPGLARVYLNATDPKLATRTWQDVMENILTKKRDDALKRWETPSNGHW
jgi:hypothetical protein